jgi:hypothetical protein
MCCDDRARTATPPHVALPSSAVPSPPSSIPASRCDRTSTLPIQQQLDRFGFAFERRVQQQRRVQQKEGVEHALQLHVGCAEIGQTLITAA